jgi:CotH protein
MRVIRTSFLTAAFVAMACLWAPGAVADEAAALYDPGAVVFIDLTLTAEAEDDLEAEPDEYVDGTFSLTETSDGTPDGEAPAPLVPQQPAEIRLKGSVGGSFRILSEKAGFKLKFAKTEAVLGLRKMTLNNMVQDPSMVHETLAYAAFRATGIPASRTGFAYVRLNGEDLGVYLDLENLDEVGLTRIFGSFDKKTQHLYEGERGDDVVPGGVGDFDVDEGGDEADELGDLEALIDVTNGDGDGPWSERIAPYAELTEMGRMWGVEKYIAHWDGYAGHTEPGQERPNNYYLYSEPSGRFQMLPWGTDQTWVSTDGIPSREVTFDGHGGVLFNKCLEDSECFRAYWAGLNLATHTIPGLDPAALAEETVELLAPWQAEERANGRPEFDEGEVEDGIEQTLDFIAGRQAEAQAWLEANVPPDGPPSTDGDSRKQPPAAGIVPGRFAVRDGILITRIWVSGAGRVAQKATVPTRKGRARACATARRSAQAGGLVLRCPLARSVRQRLRAGGLKLTVRTTFTQDGSSPVLDVRRLFASRLPG